MKRNCAKKPKWKRNNTAVSLKKLVSYSVRPKKAYVSLYHPRNLIKASLVIFFSSVNPKLSLDGEPQRRVFFRSMAHIIQNEWDLSWHVQQAQIQALLVWASRDHDYTQGPSNVSYRCWAYMYWWRIWFLLPCFSKYKTTGCQRLCYIFKYALWHALKCIHV